jgi:hypothetical protein
MVGSTLSVSYISVSDSKLRLLLSSRDRGVEHSYHLVMRDAIFLIVLIVSDLGKSLKWASKTVYFNKRLKYKNVTVCSRLEDTGESAGSAIWLFSVL